MSETPLPEATPRRPSPASPFDAQAALVHLLSRLRSSSGATRVSVWVHEATTGLAVPFQHAVCTSGKPPPQHPALRTPVSVSDAPFLSAVITSRRPVVAHADGNRPADRQLAEVGIRSGHGEPLLLDGEVVGVLTVEPAAAAAPHLLRRVAPELAVALVEAWARRSEQRRLEQAAVLLRLIETAGQAQSMDHLLGSACRQLAELGEVERACVFLLEDGRLVPRMAAYADGRRDLATWQQFRTAPVPLPLAETVLRTGEVMTADRGSGLISGWWVDSFRIASALAVPLGRSPELAGVLSSTARTCARSPRTSAGWPPPPGRTSAG